MCFVKMNWDFSVLNIFKVNPFVFYNFKVLYFLFNHESFKHFLINYWKDCRNSESIHDRLLKGSDSPEKEITFVKWNLLNFRILM